MLVHVEASGADVWKNAEVLDASLHGMAERFAERMDERVTRKEVVDPSAKHRAMTRAERDRQKKLEDEERGRDFTFIRLEPDSRFVGITAAETTIMATGASGVEWELLATSSRWQPRELHRMVAVRKKTKAGYITRLLIFGGRDAREQPLGDAWYSDDGGQSWLEVVPAIPKKEAQGGAPPALPQIANG
mmetsp:Transcript_9086/g.19220  ORF Transcript_9086/g.19220 Transcript_9086/m.19220 type:complete len:189 (+) Transcript_9086:49-615(+)